MTEPKLSDDDVLVIRRRYRAGEYADVLAGEFLISTSYVSRIIRGDRRGDQEAVVGPPHRRRVVSWAVSERGGDGAARERQRKHRRR